MEDKEIIQEFLIESAENLARLDQEIVDLEQRPRDTNLLSSIFRTIHTVKGTCGFLGYDRLGAVAHVAETILNELRNGERHLDGELTTLILEAVDAIRRFLSAIEADGTEGVEFEQSLLVKLHAAASTRPVLNTAAKPAPPAAAPPAPAAVKAEAVPSAGPLSPALPPEVPPPLHLAAAAAASSSAAAGSSTPGADAQSGARESAAADTTLRVDLGLLDKLMNLVGELVLTRNQVLQYTAAREDTALNAISQRLNLITSELQERVMKTRMQPIGVVWNKLPRVVRDLSTTLQKQISVELVGTQTELDRAVIEAIKDPLTHVVRNSCDHGIESPADRVRAGKPACGRLTLRAFHESGQVNIEIQDDGAGIDLERVRAKAVERGLIAADQAQRLSERECVNLLFLPGFSTARSVTSVSGRGVGMDVVRTNIERINGAIEMSSVYGQGTTVRIRIPLTLAIIPGLLVTAGGERFVIPQLNLQELIRFEGADALRRIEHIDGTRVLRHRERLLPLAGLCETLELEPRPTPDEVSIVVVRVDGHCFGLIVDSINDTQEIVVKPLGQQLKGLQCYAGATIMGDGRVALILDVAGLGRRANVLATTAKPGATAASEAAAQALDLRRSLLLFRAGELPRVAILLADVARLEKIPRSRVEQAAGRDVIQYRDRVLPLVSLGQMFGGSAPDDPDMLNVIVHGSGEASLGLMVDEIIDIVEESVTNLAAADRHALLGSAVVGDRMTDFLDLDAVAALALPRNAEESVARLQAALAMQERGSAREALR
jgi:two-component system chemotaxis sensor kinase CheA